MRRGAVKVRGEDQHNGQERRQVTARTLSNPQKAPREASPARAITDSCSQNPTSVKKLK